MTLQCRTYFECLCCFYSIITLRNVFCKFSLYKLCHVLFQKPLLIPECSMFVSICLLYSSLNWLNSWVFPEYTSHFKPKTARSKVKQIGWSFHKKCMTDYTVARKSCCKLSCTNNLIWESNPFFIKMVDCKHSHYWRLWIKKFSKIGPKNTWPMPCIFENIQAHFEWWTHTKQFKNASKLMGVMEF